MLVAPGVSVPVPFVIVKLPASRIVPAPPDISITAVTDVEAAELKTRFPPITSVPVVVTILAIRPVDVLLPPIFTFPVTVTAPALTFNATTLLADGCVMVMLPFTVSVFPLARLNDELFALRSNVNPDMVLSVFIV